MILKWLAVLPLFVCAPAIAETLTNDTVATLVAAGISDDAVIAKIKASDYSFDLSIDQIIALKNRGVSGAVIAAMLDRSAPKAPVAAAMSIDAADPMAPHPAGVYLLQGEAEAPRMQRIDATMSNQAKTGGFLGYALTGGIASMSVKASIQNPTARVKTTQSTPIFYFFFDESNPGVQSTSAWAAGSAATVTAPSEFTLIQLMIKKDRREARVGSMNIGGAKTGVMDKDRLTFDYSLVRPGVYKVVPVKPLDRGEYGFIFSIAGGGSGGALTAKVFDFSVTGPAIVASN